MVLEDTMRESKNSVSLIQFGFGKSNLCGCIFFGTCDKLVDKAVVFYSYWIASSANNKMAFFDCIPICSQNGVQFCVIATECNQAIVMNRFDIVTG